MIEAPTDAPENLRTAEKFTARAGAAFYCKTTTMSRAAASAIVSTEEAALRRSWERRWDSDPSD